MLHAQGQVAFGLTKAGRVDTNMLHVVSVRGVSPGGFRSAVVRELAGCRFDRSLDSASSDVSVVTLVTFDSAALSVTPAIVATGREGVLEVPAHPTVPSEAIEATDSTVEERPRRQSCSLPPEPSPFGGTYRTMQDRDAAYAAWQRMNSGTVAARIVVEVDGTVPVAGIVIVSSTNPSMRTMFLSVLSSCRYVPGRISGVLVATIVATKTSIGRVSGLP